MTQGKKNMSFSILDSLKINKIKKILIGKYNLQ